MTAESPLDAVVGTVLEGTYRITRLIGEGGMGAVYEAMQLRLNKRVAIKLMARELASNQEALARFRREAEITSHLGHPHLVTVMDFGQAKSGEPYLVMEYLDGEDLDHRLRRVGRMSIEAAVHVIRQVASALNAAHDQGVVHRDLKPGNIFLSQIPGEPDFVKVLDFGISKMKAARTQLTKASAVIGTPNYMSPEQASGMVDEIDHHADQWAMGCIAWEMLLGRGPFVADDAGALFYQILNLNPQPLTPRVPGLPPEVEPVLRRALNKQPAARFPSMRDFSRAFESAAFGRPSDATPAPVLVSLAPASNATIGYSATRFQGAPARPAVARPPQAAPRLEAPARDPVAHVVRSARKPEADTLQPIDDPVRGVALWNRVKPIYAVIAAKPVHAIIAAASVLLLLLATFLFLRSGAAHKAPPPSPAPVVTPLPQSPSPVTTPEPMEAKPVEAEPGWPSGKRSKKPNDVNGRKKPNPFGGGLFDDSLSSKKTNGVNGPKKPNPLRGNPFDDSPRPKSQVKAKKKLYEDL
jgi:serine/threonine-protein kinase